MKFKIKDFEMTAQDFAVILYDLSAMNNDFSFDWPEEFNKFMIGNCIEDKVANVLMEGGYLWVMNNTQRCFDKEDITNDSEVLYIDHIDYDEDYDVYVPVYKLTRERVAEAFQQMILNDSPQAKEVHHSFIEIFDIDNGSADWYDYWNVFQFILFGEIVYC